MSGGRLVVLDRAGRATKEYPLPSGMVTLGSDRSCDITILLPSVRPHHATVVVHANQSVVRNVSDGETLVNGRAVSAAALAHGDELALGGRVLRWLYDQPLPTPPPSLPGGAVVPPTKVEQQTKTDKVMTAALPRSASAGSRLGRGPRRASGGGRAPQRSRSVQLALELSHRASMPANAGGKQVAVVQPQRRDTSEQFEAQNESTPSSPRSPARSRASRKQSPLTEDGGAGNTGRSSASASPLLGNDTATKASQWIESRKGGRPWSGRKSTPLRPALLRRAHSAKKANNANATATATAVAKIQAPLTIDHTKQAAIMLMTGHTPRKLSTPQHSPALLVKKRSPVGRPSATPKGKRGRDSKSPRTPKSAAKSPRSPRSAVKSPKSPNKTAVRGSAPTGSGKRSLRGSARGHEPSVLEITDTDSQSSWSQTSRSSAKHSPLLASPRKSALKDPTVKTARKTESIKFDLSNLEHYPDDSEVHSFTSNSTATSKTRSNCTSDDDITLHYSNTTSPSPSPSPRRSIHSRTSKILEQAGSPVKETLLSEHKTLTPESPQARKSFRGSLIVQKALDLSETVNVNETSRYSRRRTKTSDQSGNTSYESASRTRTLSPKSPTRPMETYSVVDLISNDSDETTKTSLYDSLVGSTRSSSILFGTPQNSVGRKTRSTIDANFLGSSTPYLVRGRISNRSQSNPGSGRRSSPVKGSTTRRSSSLTATQTPTSQKHISINSTRVSRVSKSQSRINDSDLQFMSTTNIEMEEESPKFSRRSSSQSQTSTNASVRTVRQSTVVGQSPKFSPRSSLRSTTSEFDVQSPRASSRFSVADVSQASKAGSPRDNVSPSKRKSSRGAVSPSKRSTPSFLSPSSQRSTPTTLSPSKQKTPRTVSPSKRTNPRTVSLSKQKTPITASPRSKQNTPTVSPSKRNTLRTVSPSKRNSPSTSVAYVSPTQLRSPTANVSSLKRKSSRGAVSPSSPTNSPRVVSPSKRSTRGGVSPRELTSPRDRKFNSSRGKLSPRVSIRRLSSANKRSSRVSGSKISPLKLNARASGGKKSLNKRTSSRTSGEQNSPSVIDNANTSGTKKPATKKPSPRMSGAKVSPLNKRTSRISGKNSPPNKRASSRVSQVTFSPGNSRNSSRLSQPTDSPKNKSSRISQKPSPHSPQNKRNSSRRTLTEDTTFYDSSQEEGMVTPENAGSPDEVGTPVLSIKSLLDSSQSSFASHASPRATRATISRNSIGTNRPSKNSRNSLRSKSFNVALRRSLQSVRGDQSRSKSADESVSQDEDVVTPKSAVKIVQEAVKNRHSTAKKPLSKRSIIDTLNESDIVKQLFNSPVKRKLSQSMTEFSRKQLFDDAARRPKRNTVALTDRTPDSSMMEGTREITPENFVSPLETPGQSPNLSGVKRLFRRNTPNNDLRHVKGVKSLLRTPRTRKSVRNDLTKVSGVKEVFAKSPRNRLSDVRVKEVFVASPKNDLRRVTGVKSLFQSENKRKSPKNTLEDVAGVRNLFTRKSVANDLRNVSGVKKTMAKSPKNDLRDVRGVRSLFREEKQSDNYSDLSGVEELFDESSSFRRETDVIFDQLVGKPPIKAVYSKSVLARRQPKRKKRNKSLHTSIEVITNNVEQWLEEELKKRVQPASKVAKELQRLATDTVEGGDPLRTSRVRNSSLLRNQTGTAGERSGSTLQIYSACLPIKKRSLTSTSVEKSPQEKSHRLPIKKRAVLHSTPVKGRPNLTMNASELGRVSPIAAVDYSVAPRIQQAPTRNQRSVRTIDTQHELASPNRGKVPTNKSPQKAKQSPQKANTTSPKVKLTKSKRGKETEESTKAVSPPKLRGRRGAVASNVYNPVETASNARTRRQKAEPSASVKSPGRKRKQELVVEIQRLDIEPISKRMKKNAEKPPSPVKKSPVKITRAAKAAPSPDKLPAVRGRRNKTQDLTDNKPRQATRKPPVSSPAKAAPQPAKSKAAPQQSAKTKVEPQKSAKTKASPRKSATPSPVKGGRSRRNKTADTTIPNAKKRRASLVIGKKAPVMSPKPKGKVSPIKESKRGKQEEVVATPKPVKATRAKLVVAKPSPKMKPQGSTRQAQSKPESPKKPEPARRGRNAANQKQASKDPTPKKAATPKTKRTRTKTELQVSSSEPKKGLKAVNSDTDEPANKRKKTGKPAGKKTLASPVRSPSPVKRGRRGNVTQPLPQRGKKTPTAKKNQPAKTETVATETRRGRKRKSESEPSDVPAKIARNEKPVRGRKAASPVKASKAQKQATPKEITPKVKRATSKAQAVSPKTKKVTPKPKVVTSKPKKATPKPKVDTPKPKKATPKTKVVTPKPKKATPKTKVVTTKSKKVASKAAATPKIKLVSPKAKKAQAKSINATNEVQKGRARNTTIETSQSKPQARGRKAVAAAVTASPAQGGRGRGGKVVPAVGRSTRRV